MIRLILVALFLILFLILSIPIMLIEWIIGKFNMDLKSKSSLFIVNCAFNVIKFLSGAKIDYIGLDNIPKDTAVMYVGNHRSFFDIVFTYPKVAGLTGYISKKEIEKVPLLNVWMRNLNCLFLDRDNIKEGLKTILTAIEQIKSGISICIFPEGTRSEDENVILPFHEGSFKIASKAKCPIVPITLNNCDAVFEKHLPWIKKAHVIIEYGKPIYIDEIPKEKQKQIGSYVHDIILDTYNKNKELV